MPRQELLKSPGNLFVSFLLTNNDHRFAGMIIDCLDAEPFVNLSRRGNHHLLTYGTPPHRRFESPLRWVANSD